MADTKTCKTCKETKPLELFYRQKKFRNGKVSYCHAVHCNPCRLELNRQYKQKSRHTKEQNPRPGEGPHLVAASFKDWPVPDHRRYQGPTGKTLQTVHLQGVWGG